ncbi:MAG: DUF3472 domain-containing protein [Dysgonomonas sp.]|nr:DUF3472 domain-containing protein [Dysgonomonas sp.]
MNNYKSILFFLFSLLSVHLVAAPINIPLGGNAYLTKGIDGAKITNEGITDWKSQSTVISSWLRINEAGKLNLSVRAKAMSENVSIRVTILDQIYNIKLSGKEWTLYPIADNVFIDNAGYLRIDIQGAEKSGDYFAELSDIIIDGSAIQTQPNYVKDFSYHFGRRGPSVHLKYPFPEEDIEYFYNEVTVPQGEDVIGSYYMANGFGEGYFGMQVNSETERRILFSVWSPYDTEDPKDIPEEFQIRKLAQGEGVHIGEFGNEGSGGQSYLVYPWKAGTTYKFLTRVHPDGKGNTVYTAYFYATNEKRWRLIASFMRPKTDTWYKRAYSFLENFIPNQGYITRKVLFSNQWAVTSKGKWIEITDAAFTYDATARQQVRTDYRGGMENESVFYLQNCGFFNENMNYNTPLTRKAGNKKPEINLKKLTSLK